MEEQKKYHFDEAGKFLEFEAAYKNLLRVSDLFADPMEEMRENIFDAISENENIHGAYSREHLAAAYAHVADFFDARIVDINIRELSAFVDDFIINFDFFTLIEEIEEAVTQ